MPAVISPKKPYVKTINLYDEDMLIMISDGVEDAVCEEGWVFAALSKNPSSHLSENVDFLASVAYEASRDNPDDITVLGIKILH